MNKLIQYLVPVFFTLFFSSYSWSLAPDTAGPYQYKETIEDDDDRDRLDETLKRYDGDKTKTEQSFNITEIPSLFGKNLAETADEEDLALAERLAQMWRHRLQVVYPDRKFIIQILSAEETEV